MLLLLPGQRLPLKKHQRQLQKQRLFVPARMKMPDLTSIQKTATMTIVPILPTAPILPTTRIPPIRLLMILELIIPATPATVTLQMKVLQIRAVMILQIRSIIHLMTDLKTPQSITVIMIPRRIVGILLPIPAAAILLTPQTVPLLILPLKTAIIKN